MPKENFYHPELDGLRFFAFLLVFIHHAPILLEKSFFATFHEYGWVGVDLFLCLSAFLFARLLFIEHQAKGDINIKNFYIRRALRIWPLYFIFLGIMLVLTVRELGWSASLFQRTLGATVFADNIFAAFFGYNQIANSPHLWTISYEEQFYAIIPWSLRKIFKMERDKKIRVILFVFLTFSLIRAALIYFTVPHPAIWVLPITHFESILGGLVVGLGLADDRLKKIPAWLLMTAGIVSLTIVSALPNAGLITWYLMLTYPLVGLGTSLILSSVVREKQWFVKSVLQHKWLAYLGKISYGLYVYHLLAINYGAKIAQALSISQKRLVVYPVSVFGIALCLTILVSIASYQLMEKPFLRLKERFSSIESRPI